MRALRGAATLALTLALGTSGGTATAEPHLTIVTSDPGALPVDKIADALGAALPDLSFTISRVSDRREGSPSARLVRWADERVVVGYCDALGREDVRIVDPGPEPAVAIAAALVELRASLRAEPFHPIAEEDEDDRWSDDDDQDGEPDPESLAPQPLDAPAAFSPPRSRTARRLLPIGRLSISVGFGNGSLRMAETRPVEPYGILGADLAFFPGALHGLDGLAAGFGVVIGVHSRGGGGSYSSRDLDVAFALQLPLARDGGHWFRVRAGYRWFSEAVAQEPRREDRRAEVTRFGYQGVLAGAEAVFAVSPDLVLTTGLAVHTVSFGSGPDSMPSEDDSRGAGWIGKLGCGGRGPLAWSLDVEVIRHFIGLAGWEAAQTNVQTVLGLGWGI